MGRLPLAKLAAEPEGPSTCSLPLTPIAAPTLAAQGLNGGVEGGALSEPLRPVPRCQLPPSLGLLVQVCGFLLGTHSGHSLVLKGTLWDLPCEERSMQAIETPGGPSRASGCKGQAGAPQIALDKEPAWQGPVTQRSFCKWW